MKMLEIISLIKKSKETKITFEEDPTEVELSGKDKLDKINELDNLDTG